MQNVDLDGRRPVERRLDECPALVLGALVVGHDEAKEIALGLVVDECVEGIRLTQVLEEVLLAPAFEHPEGDFDKREVHSRGEDGRLVLPIVGEQGDLPQTSTTRWPS